MKKIIFVFILTMMSQFAFSQSEIMRFLSMGFNAKQDQRYGRFYYDYYFYGFEDYSEAFIYSDRVEFKIGERTFYPNARIVHGFPPYEYTPYRGQNNSVGYETVIPTQGIYGEEHKFENGRLVYWARTERVAHERISFTTTDRIEQNAQNIIIYYKVDEINFHYRYYNISRAELLDMFLKKYVELICSINEIVNTYDRNDASERIMPVFQGRTARELAIFRNCLYAIKGYRFSNSSWTNFFNKYLDGYNARYSNAEVTAMFSENEKWLFDLVVQQGNGR